MPQMTPEEVARYKQRIRNPDGSFSTERTITIGIDDGYINIAQAYFCLHYIADEMPNRNEEFLKTVRDFGFGWFEKYEPNVK